MPLRKVSYSVFALGSSGYPKFCAFGKKLDDLMLELGARQMYPVGTGDELIGQEQSFITWTQGTFKVSKFQIRFFPFSGLFAVQKSGKCQKRIICNLDLKVMKFQICQKCLLVVSLVSKTTLTHISFLSKT